MTSPRRSSEAGARARESASEADTRAGFVVLVGLPNAGKSTLLNAVLGEHLSIVTPKAQTTWQRVAGIRTETGRGAPAGSAEPHGEFVGVQMILVDTPGIVTGESLFHRSMMIEARRAIDDGDVVVAVVDGAAGRRGGRGSARGLPRGRRPEGAAAQDADGWTVLRNLLAGAPGRVVVAANKSDRARFDAGAARELATRAGAHAVEVSAMTGAGLDELLAVVRAGLPAGPFLYPEDDVAAAPARFFVQELVRETVLERYRQEIPYSVAVRVEEFREAEDPVYIAASLHVERKSQKGMLIGRKGAAIKALGAAARAKVEQFLGRRVYLDLWVKVTEGWRRKRGGLAMFGYVVPDEE